MELSTAAGDAYSQPFWDGLARRQLLAPRCRACGHVQFPMGPCCSACLGEDMAWEALSGKGAVWAYAIYHHAFNPALAARVPYNVAVVALDEGPQVITNIVGIDSADIANGMRVTAVYEPDETGVTLLRFEPETGT